MVTKDLTAFRDQDIKDFQFQAEIMNKAIWGDMGEDSAMITITCVNKAYWQYHYIRTQSGDPSPFDDFICEVIDEYEKELSDEALYDVLALHTLLPDFEQAMHQYCKKASIS